MRFALAVSLAICCGFNGVTASAYLIEGRPLRAAAYAVISLLPVHSVIHFGSER